MLDELAAVAATDAHLGLGFGDQDVFRQKGFLLRGLKPGRSRAWPDTSARGPLPGAISIQTLAETSHCF